MGNAKSVQTRIELKPSDIFVFSARRGQNKASDHDSEYLYLESLRPSHSHSPKDIIKIAKQCKVNIKIPQVEVSDSCSNIHRIDVSQPPSYWRHPKSHKLIASTPLGTKEKRSERHLLPQISETNKDETYSQDTIPSFDSLENELFDTDHKRNALIKPNVKYSSYKLIKLNQSSQQCLRYTTPNPIKDLFSLKQTSESHKLKPASFNLSDIIKKPKVQSHKISWSNIREICNQKNQCISPRNMCKTMSVAHSPKSPFRSEYNIHSGATFKIITGAQSNKYEESKISSPSFSSKKSRAEHEWKWKGAHGAIFPKHSRSNV